MILKYCTVYIHTYIKKKKKDCILGIYIFFFFFNKCFVHKDTMLSALLLHIQIQVCMYIQLTIIICTGYFPKNCTTNDFCNLKTEKQGQKCGCVPKAKRAITIFMSMLQKISFWTQARGLTVKKKRTCS